MRTDVLISYDVNTETSEGRSRLRRVAKICKNFGQRVQWSVFECTVSAVQLEQLRERVLRVLNEEEDSLRIYRLPGGREKCVEAYGVDKYVDFEKPLIV